MLLERTPPAEATGTYGIHLVHARQERRLASRRGQCSIHALAPRGERLHRRGRAPSLRDLVATGGKVFTSYTAAVSGNLGLLAIALPVDVTPNDAKQRYTLEDNIVLRNSPRVTP